MKIYVKASKQYDIENTPYSIVNYNSYVDVVYTDSLQLVRTFSDYIEAYNWIMRQTLPKSNADSSPEKQENAKKREYVIYAKGTKIGTQALFRKHRGPAQYCDGVDAEKFTRDELSKYTARTKRQKYEWIAKEISD